MKKPTIDEMKLLVAGMIPDMLTVDYSLYVKGSDWRYEKRAFWLDTNMAVTSREWLYVCHLAEKYLGFHDAPEWPEHEAPGTAYSYILNQVCRSKNEGPLFASAESRLEALCRIKHPDLFQ